MTTTSNQNLPPQPAQVDPNAIIDPSDHEHTLVLIDQTRDAKDFSRDIADARIAEELNTGGRFKRFVKGIWKGNVAHEYYRQKYISEAQSTIVSSQDINAHETDLGSRQRATEATINRFTSEYDELVHDGAGEQKREAANDGPLASAAKQIIREYALGNLDDTTIVEERNRILNELRQQGNNELIGQGLVMVDNLIKVAQAVKGSVEHGQSIDDVLGNMRVVTAEARSGVRTEARYSKTDKVIEKMNKIPGVGKWLSPTAVGVAAGVVTTLARFGSSYAAKAAAFTGVGAVVAGTFAGMKENKRFKDEKAQHDREMAQGKGFAPGAKKREKFETARYQSVSASDKIAELGAYFEDGALDNAAARQDAYNKLALLQARIDRSDTSKADLITYSSTTGVEQERFDLDVARARLKVELKNSLDGADPTELAALGYDPTQTMNVNLASRSENFLEVLDEDKTAKDKLFKKMKRNAVLGAAAIGAASSFASGLVVQEGLAMVDSSRFGLVEQALGGNAPSPSTHNTVLEGVFGDHDTGDAVATSVHHDASGAFTQHAFGEGNVSVSSDHQLIDHGDGTFSLADPSGEHTINGLTVDAHGTLSPESIKMLEANGMTVDDLSQTTMIDTPPIHQDVQTDIHGFTEAHQGDTTHVTRDLWYDNDTPAPNYDQNELGLEWGGGNGTGIGPDGGYTMSAGSMTESGSFHDGLSANWQEQAQQGNLKLAISATGDTQTQVYMVGVNPDGSINIPKDSPAAQFFHTEQVPVVGEDGGPVLGADGQTVMQDHLVFDGKYAEVVQTTGVDEAGVEHIRPLATHTGTDTLADRTFTTSTEVPQPPTAHVTPDYQIHTGGYDTVETTPGETFTEMAPSIPVASRRALENLVEQNLKNPDMSPMYYGGGSLENARDWLRSNPDLLKSRKKITNQAGESIWVEADGSPVERSVDKERSAIGAYMDRLRQDNPEHMRLVDSIADAMPPMDDQCRVAINVPAWMEGKGLNHFLTQFTNQVDRDGNAVDPKSYEVNVIVNRKTGTEADDSVGVIQRFIAAYQQQHGVAPRVNYYDIELDPPNNNVGYARKLLTDAVVMRSARRARQDANLYIESEDADVLRADPKTVSNLITKFDANPQLDALRGVQDRDPGYLKDNDYLFMRRRAWDFFEIMAREKRFQDPTKPDWNNSWNRTVTGGWNTGYTAEAYAGINGYESATAGEDMQIGERISMIRGDGHTPNLEVIGTVSTRSDSSPRRFIQEIIQGKGAYEDFADETANREIREKSIPELMDVIKSHARVSDTNNGDFASYLNAIPHWTKSVTGGSAADSDAMTRRILFMLGFKKNDYGITDDKITINNWSNFSGALETYRNRWDARQMRTATT